ncbi:MAG: helix-turn-helix domain-containing protein [Campylobacteraceae bacterium]|nr:helix-turn-helix domain-containing protein [Campylobacteraceae bacterium]
MASFYAVIPANVRYNKNIPPAAKLLYAEITSLINASAYCWAKNSYFADLYGVSENSIQKWLSALQKENFITVQITKNSKGTERKITVNNGGHKNLYAGVENFTPAYMENNINKNRDINISTKSRRKASQMPSEILRCVKPEVWQEWIAYRKEKKQSLTSMSIKRQLEFLNKQLDDFREDPNEIILQSIKNGWTGLFPLKKDKPPRPAPKANTNAAVDAFFDKMENNYIDTIDEAI